MSDGVEKAILVKATEANARQDATTLATEVTRYLETIDLFRLLGLNIKWRSEANEWGAQPPARAAAISQMRGLRRPARTDQRATRLFPDVNQRRREHHDVNAEARDTPRRIHRGLAASLSGCA